MHPKIPFGLKDRIHRTETDKARDVLRFFDLPPGVRNEIYDNLFGDRDRNSGIAIPLIKSRRGKGNRLRTLLTSQSHSWSTWALLLVSRKMYNETADYVWRDAHATLFEFEDAWGRDRVNILKVIEGGRVLKKVSSLHATMHHRLALVHWLKLSKIDTLYLMTRLPGEHIGHRLGQHTLDWWMQAQLTETAASLARVRLLMPQLQSITISDICFDHIPVRFTQWMSFLLPASLGGVQRVGRKFPRLQRIHLEGSQRGQSYCLINGGRWYELHTHARVEEIVDQAALERTLKRWRKDMELCPALWN